MGTGTKNALDIETDVLLTRDNERLVIEHTPPLAPVDVPRTLLPFGLVPPLGVLALAGVAFFNDISPLFCTGFAVAGATGVVFAWRSSRI